MGGNYLLSASYSMITNMLFYSNLVFSDPLFESQVGNLFFPVPDECGIIESAW